MAAIEDQSTSPLPLILLHRKPFLIITRFEDLLSLHFRLIDTRQSPPPSSSSLSSVRAAVILGRVPFTAEHLRSLPSLKLVAATTAGTDHIDLQACRLRGVAVTGVGDSFTDDVADCAIALLIGVLRRVSAADRFVRSGSWPLRRHYPLGSKIGGKRVGIVGLGKIGSAIAQRLSAFGCKIAYNSRNEKPSAPFTYYASVRDMASESDVHVVCCALTEATRRIIDKEVMRALGKDGVIINVGRGSLVDEQELVQSLARGELGGAGLDVFENEPHPPKELLDLDNVVLSPHSALRTPESMESLSQTVLANLKAFFSNKPLLSSIQQD